MYLPVPSKGGQYGSDRETQTPWRVIIAPVRQSHQPLALEILGDTTIGSSMDGQPSPDVNLADWHGYDQGVSRLHLMLRPSPSKLFLLDLRSTNGTTVNGLPLGVGWAYALQDGDVVTLGSLQIRLGVVQRP